MLVYMFDVYCCDLDVLVVWVELCGVVVEVFDVDVLCQFVVDEYCRGLLVKSLQCCLLVCCSFYVWLFKYGCIEVSFVVMLKVLCVLC